MIGKYRIFRLLIVFTAVLGFALSPAVTPALAITYKDICEGAGGTWVTVDGFDTGLCFFPVELSPDLCPGFEYYVVIVIDFSVTIVGCGDSTDPDLLDERYFAVVGSTGNDCINEGGIWQGTMLGEDGTCTFPAGSDNALADCGPGFDSIYAIVAGVVSDPICVPAGSGGGTGSAYPPFGRFGAAVNGIPGSGSLTLGGGRNGNVAFDPGTCAGKCTISPNLPAGAQGKLPADVVATLYFRTTDTDGNPGTGTYTVCFDASALTSPVIYRYVGNEWVAQPLTYSGGQVCTTASGDGAFALGGS